MKNAKKQVPFTFVLGTDRQEAITHLTAIKDAMSEALFAVIDNELIYGEATITCLRKIHMEADLQYRKLQSGPMRA